MNKKYSLVVEGQTEDITIKSIKTDLLSKLYPDIKKVTLCKKHSRLINGCVSLKELNEDVSKCCTKFLIFDKDDNDDRKIIELQNKANKVNVKIILSNPLFEINLLPFYQEVTTIREQSFKCVYL
ncbi:MAG: RloB family protein [Ureaplasma sp.]|nr:RloB family protein [Ureaplasma sp.]